MGTKSKGWNSLSTSEKTENMFQSDREAIVICNIIVKYNEGDANDDYSHQPSHSWRKSMYVASSRLRALLPLSENLTSFKISFKLSMKVYINYVYLV